MCFPVKKTRFFQILAFGVGRRGAARSTIALECRRSFGETFCCLRLLLENPQGQTAHTVGINILAPSVKVQRKQGAEPNVLDGVFTVGNVCHAAGIRFFIRVIVAAGHEAETPTRHV